MIEKTKGGVARRRILLLAACGLGITIVVGCSGKSSRKAPGPDETAITGASCDTECCCRVVDGYYRRHDCTSRETCTAAGGECLPADTARCRH